MQPPLIELRDINRVFSTEDLDTYALCGINIEIRRGEYISVEGPSGCGKSTLLSILGLLDRATSGTYRFDGTMVSDLGDNARSRLRNLSFGFVFQAFNLIGDLTILENVQLPLRYRCLAPGKRKDAAMAALARVGLTHRAGHFPAQLSGGQQQRAAVARAVVGSPAILLADEPTGNLDSQNGESVMDLLDSLHAEGATICMVTHDLRYSRRAERTIRLLDGKLNEDPRRAKDADCERNPELMTSAAAD